VRDFHAALGKDIYFFFIQPEAVNGDRSVIE
jgi:hypothetical protein